VLPPNGLALTRTSTAPPSLTLLRTMFRSARGVTRRATRENPGGSRASQCGPLGVQTLAQQPERLHICCTTCSSGSSAETHTRSGSSAAVVIARGHPSGSRTRRRPTSQPCSPGCLRGFPRPAQTRCTPIQSGSVGPRANRSGPGSVAGAREDAPCSPGTGLARPCSLAEGAPAYTSGRPPLASPRLSSVASGGSLEAP
jgi:hypothetical protein